MSGKLKNNRMLLSLQVRGFLYDAIKRLQVGRRGPPSDCYRYYW